MAQIEKQIRADEGLDRGIHQSALKISLRLDGAGAVGLGASWEGIDSNGNGTT